MTNHRDNTIAVLRAIAELGPVTVNQIDTHPGLDIPSASSKNAVMALSGDYLVTSFKPERGPRQYTINRQGLALLRKMDMAEGGGFTGSIAQPRRIDFRASWTPPRPAEAPRAGSMHAFTLPSLQNGECHPRVRPMLIAAQPNRKL